MTILNPPAITLHTAFQSGPPVGVQLGYLGSQWLLVISAISTGDILLAII